jgi:hypothetical protein
MFWAGAQKPHGHWQAHGILSAAFRLAPVNHSTQKGGRSIKRFWVINDEKTFSRQVKRLRFNKNLHNIGGMRLRSEQHCPCWLLGRVCIREGRPLPAPALFAFNQFLTLFFTVALKKQSAWAALM